MARTIRFNPVAWNFVSKRINELYYKPKAQNLSFDQTKTRIETLSEIITHFANHFAKDNPKFDREKFIDACIDKRD